MAESIATVRLQTLLPASLKEDTRVKAAAQALDAALQASAKASEACLLLPHLEALPEVVLDLLAWQWHVDFYEPIGLTAQKKCALIQRSIAWHRQKGTSAAVRAVVEAAYGNCELQEWYEYDGEPYHFKVRVTLQEESADKSRWKDVLAAVESAKNARSWLEVMLFYYPDIHMPVEPQLRCETIGLVEARHILWNLGAARSVRRDGEYNRNGLIRYSGIHPDEKYRELQAHQATCEAFANARQPYALAASSAISQSVETNLAIEYRLAAYATQQESARQQAAPQNSVEATGTVLGRQERSYRIVNLRDGSFCRDGSHTRANSSAANSLLKNLCTIKTIRNGMEAFETV